MNEEPCLVLGLDIREDACGWALVDERARCVVDAGVREWDVPRDPKTRASTAQIRHLARSNRRNLERNRNRRKHCLALLRAEGLVPAEADAGWLQTRAGDAGPLQARARGLDERLDERTWAQVLYNLCARRGHIPHGRSAEGDEGRRMLYAIKRNRKAMAEGGFRTVGELLAHQGRSRNHGDEFACCVANEQIEDEVRLLFRAQRRLGNPHADEAFEQRYHEVASWRKDMSEHDRAVYELVGPCEIFERDKRAPRACPSAEEAACWERLGGVRVIGADGAERALAHATRLRAVEALFAAAGPKGNKHGRVTFADLRSWEGLDAGAFFKGVAPEDERVQEVAEPRCWRALRSALPKDLMAKLADDRPLADAVAEAVARSSCRATLDELTASLPLSADERAAVADVDFANRIFTGYGRLGLRALQQLCATWRSRPLVLSADDARTALGWEADAGEAPAGGRLGAYADFDDTCLDPVMLRAMAQVRRIVNAVCACYGPPQRIRLELAAELKHSRKEQRSIAQSNRVLEQRRQASTARIAQALGADPDDPRVNAVLERAQLYDEQGGCDIYTGEPLDFDRLVAGDEELFVDHILPYERSCENGRANRVLCWRATAREKRGKSPFEWLGGTPAFDELRERLAAMPGYPQGKKQRLLMTSFRSNERRTAERNCTDTRWVTRQVAAYLERGVPWAGGEGAPHVSAVSSAATAALRKAWRIDGEGAGEPLHRVATAAVVAVCTVPVVKAVAHQIGGAASLSADAIPSIATTLPWLDFPAQVTRARDAATPTRRPDHTVTGHVFEDTVYRFDGLSDDGAIGRLHSRNRGDKVSRNYVEGPDGSARIRDELAFLRLWWSDAGGRGGREGRYYAEPVYLADLPRAFEADYVPLVAPPSSDKRPRDAWDPLPEELRAQKPIVLFRGDPVRIDGQVRRFRHFDISGNSWSLSDPYGRLTWREATFGMPYRSLDANRPVEPVHEDVLGHCYRVQEAAPALDDEGFDPADGLGA